MPEVFTCRRCGQCCEGRGGIVLSSRDLQRLADWLGEDENRVLEQYTEKSGGKPRLKTGDSGWCIFFEASMGCTIHDGKPDICRAWPFFRGNLEDPASLALAKDFCPGIDPGVPHWQFRQAGLKYLQECGLLHKDASQDPAALVISRTDSE